LKLGKAKNALETAHLDGLAEGKVEGKAEGEKAKAIDVAKTMLAKGFDVETIAEITKLTTQEVAALKGK
jgi:predicted transposase/invertase (TIGR01784 family)